MGVRLLVGTYDGTEEGKTALVDSVSGFAFGPLFDTAEDAEAFLVWHGGAAREDTARELDIPNVPDPRAYFDDGDLETIINAWKHREDEAVV